jgi:hypothetical protein
VDAPAFAPRWNAPLPRAAAPSLVKPAIVPGWDCSCRCRRPRQRARRPHRFPLSLFAVGLCAVRRRRAVSSASSRSRRVRALARAPMRAMELACVHPSTHASRP